MILAVCIVSNFMTIIARVCICTISKPPPPFRSKLGKRTQSSRDGSQGNIQENYCT